MISIEAYRMRIGTFQQRNYHSKGKEINFECGSCLYSQIFSVMNLQILLSVMIIVNMTFLKMSLLIQSGDVEINPGPTYTILKSVTGSFHQGNSRFGTSAGSQCLCNALYAIGYSVYKRVGLWSKSDLDDILTFGNQLRQTINVDNFLSTDHLPESICVNSTDLQITKLGNYHGNLCTGLHFISNVHVSNENKGNGLILIFNGYSISILWNKAHFFLFDPHSRDSRGAVISDGASVLLAFRSMRAVEHYLLETFANESNSILLDMQYIEASSTERSIDFEQNKVDKERSRKRKYMASSYETFKFSDNYASKLEMNKRYKIENHEKVSEKNKQYKTEHREKISEMNKKYNLRHSEKVSEIKKQYKTGHREKVSEMNRKYHEKNNKKIKEAKQKRKALYDSATAIRKFKAAVQEGIFVLFVTVVSLNVQSNASMWESIPCQTNHFST